MHLYFLVTILVLYFQFGLISICYSNFLYLRRGVSITGFGVYLIMKMIKGKK